MKRLAIILLLMAVIASTLLASCGDTEKTTTTTPAQTTATSSVPTTSPTTETSKYGGTLIRPLSVDPVKLGYTPENPGIPAIAACPALETFMRYRAGGVLEPMLATDWEVANDGTSLTVHLRQGIKFHDGSDFTAEVAKWNLDGYLALGLYKEFKSIDVVDEHTIRVKVAKYSNMVLENLAGAQIASKAAFDKNGIDWARLNPIGTGPFVFVSYERDAKIVYKKNPNYWKEGQPYLEGFQWVIIPDETVRKIAFENGEIHTIRALGLTAQELQQKGFDYVALSGGTFILIPSSANPDSPLSNPKVRLAISYAIDREALASALGYGFIKPAYQCYPGFSAAIPNIEKQTRNLDKAKALLKEAGYPDGFETSIYCFGQVVPKDYITAIANMLNEIGIKATAEFPEMGAYMQMYQQGWEGLLGHALYATVNLNYPIQTYFRSTMYLPSLAIPDLLKEKADASLMSVAYDPAKMREVLQVVYDNTVVIPYVEETAVEFIRDGVHNTGLMEVALDQFYPGEAWLDPSIR